ncbi:MAG: FG-GAP repeat domain-containing protein [Armatimonadota bacterium]
MKKKYITYMKTVIILIFLCAGCAHRSNTGDASKQTEMERAVFDGSGGQIIKFSGGDFDKDGSFEYAAITCRKVVKRHPMGGEIVIVQRDGPRLKAIWRQKNLNPWKLEIADVDGDGKKEVIAGVWKKSPKDPVMAKRVFVYTWNGERLMPKWLGSRLSRRFSDFTFFDINSDGWDELLAMEEAPGGNHRVSAYRWRVFGFDWLDCSKELSGLTGFATNQNGVFAGTGDANLKVEYRRNHIMLSNK